MMKAAKLSNDGLPAIETPVSSIHFGYGMNAFDSSRRLSSENREAVINILSGLETLIDGTNENDIEKWETNWKILRDNVKALSISEDAQCAASLFSNLRFLAPPSEIREIHR